MVGGEEIRYAAAGLSADERAAAGGLALGELKENEGDGAAGFEPFAVAVDVEVAFTGVAKAEADLLVSFGEAVGDFAQLEAGLIDGIARGGAVFKEYLGAGDGVAPEVAVLEGALALVTGIVGGCGGGGVGLAEGDFAFADMEAGEVDADGGGGGGFEDQAIDAAAVGVGFPGALFGGSGGEGAVDAGADKLADCLGAASALETGPRSMAGWAVRMAAARRVAQARFRYMFVPIWSLGEVRPKDLGAI